MFLTYLELANSANSVYIYMYIYTLQYCCFYCIFDLINAALASINNITCKKKTFEWYIFVNDYDSFQNNWTKCNQIVQK